MEIHKTVLQNVVMVAYKSVFEWVVAYDRWFHMEVRLYNYMDTIWNKSCFYRTQQGLFQALLLDCKLFSRSSNRLLSFEATCNNA